MLSGREKENFRHQVSLSLTLMAIIIVVAFLIYKLVFSAPSFTFGLVSLIVIGSLATLAIRKVKNKAKELIGKKK